MTFLQKFLSGQIVIEYLFVTDISTDNLKSIPTANPFVFPNSTRRLEAASFEKSFINVNFTILAYNI